MDRHLLLCSMAQQVCSTIHRQLRQPLAPRTNFLFNVAYAAAAPDAAASGAVITSSAGAAGNLNATALTLVATAKEQAQQQH
ncbi:MAG: hypothetical protein IPI29_06575 [Ignavibacteria bacterium]|nr:hypothetical protein [Ignavibacteria bacterium]